MSRNKRSRQAKLKTLNSIDPILLIRERHNKPTVSKIMEKMVYNETNTNFAKRPFSYKINFYSNKLNDPFPT